jgi:hypothetical protein
MALWNLSAIQFEMKQIALETPSGFFNRAARAMLVLRCEHEHLGTIGNFGRDCGDVFDLHDGSAAGQAVLPGLPVGNFRRATGDGVFLLLVDERSGGNNRSTEDASIGGLGRKWTIRNAMS